MGWVADLFADQLSSLLHHAAALTHPHDVIRGRDAGGGGGLVVKEAACRQERRMK